ncbi:LysR family transcriptional regulator [Pseudomonas sp.]|uniref:LysR family transcriptional regulator n=1 Tax=Pseudomonas sp. TaxID=306 RepID=UPI0028ACD851|nr:LysR family transcriptional regulator [Pseudomonas sp.]
MKIPDLNLLVALNALLEEGSVVGAAQRMNLSAPAMSRTLSRIRDAIGDPILVRSGRGLVPTPRALELQDQIRGLVEQAHAVFTSGNVDMSTLERTFSVRANDVFVSSYGSAVRECLKKEVPKATLRFVPEGDTDDNALHEGRIDLYISSMRSFGADIKVQTLFTTSFVGLVREGHPVLDRDVDLGSFVAFEHVSVSRRGRAKGPIDRALAEHGLERHVSLITPTFHTAIFALSDSDLILPTMPRHMLGEMRRLGLRLRDFELPVPLETIVIVQAWHPRFDHDPAHRLLRRMIKRICEGEHE